MAKSVGVSRSHLYRVFMLNVGKSPIDYLTEYRINEACKLLRAGNLSIAEVAVSVGFFDQFYFFAGIQSAPRACRPASISRRRLMLPPTALTTSKGDPSCPYRKIKFSPCA